ncbi:MAG: STAS domain-containing protein [Sulfuritalea sp.]|nr:STAS domain-containing protein [Sulfuritalea sp.]
MATITYKDLGNDIRAVFIAERLDIQGTEKVEESFASLVNAGKKRVAVDISEVTFLSSVGIRMFIANAKKLKETGGSMALVVGFNAAAIKTLKVTCVDAILPMCEKFEEAEAVLKS